jgi:uncharacterized protein YifN (PemK superfamily)
MTSSPTITIKYFGNSINQSNLLGEEIYIGISEAFLPDLFNQPLSFLVKKFESKENYNWIVKQINQREVNGSSFFDVLLDENKSKVKEVSLYETINKTNKKVTRTLFTGALVEVDYGLTQSIIKDKEIKKTKRYPNVLQKNEMRKRRLAIVVKVLSEGRVQVVPVTSQNPGIDKSTFKLSKETLDPLVFYGNSGKESWALCRMTQTVSITRIIPPITKKFERQSKSNITPYIRYIRDELYRNKLNPSDQIHLSNALLQTYSPDDYLELKDIKKKYLQLLKDIEAERENNKTLIESLNDYKKICEILDLDPNKVL